MAFFTLLTHGGFMMIPLLLSALLALTVMLERFYRYHYEFQTSKEQYAALFDKVKTKEFSQAKKACEELGTPLADLVAAGIEHFDNPINEMELCMKNRAEEWIPVLEKRIEILDTVITAAPLMGLLGTITGMMGSFQVLSEKGINEPTAITGGVAEALIATATGLVIALICLGAYNYLTAKMKSFLYELESAGSRLVEIRLQQERKR